MKNKMFQKLLTGALALTMTLTLAACGSPSAAVSSSASSAAAASSAGASASGKLLHIGISQYGEHPSLDNCREGFLEGLKQAGLTEGTDFEADYQNAGFDNTVATQIAQKFSAANVDLMVAVATPSATACY